MGVLAFNFPMTVNPIIRIHRFAKFESPSSNLQLCHRRKVGAGFSERRRFYCSSYGGEEQLDSPQELRVPSCWLEPSRAAEVNSIYFASLKICLLFWRILIGSSNVAVCIGIPWFCFHRAYQFESCRVLSWFFWLRSRTV